jgi:hypothetical protein
MLGSSNTNRVLTRLVPQRSGEVDALHLAATEGAALAVKREVVQAHVAQVFKAGVDFVEQEV